MQSAAFEIVQQYDIVEEWVKTWHMCYILSPARLGQTIALLFTTFLQTLTGHMQNFTFAWS